MVEGDVPTLISRIEKAACSSGTFSFVSPAGADTIGWGELHEDARAYAAAMQARGIQPGDHVAVLGPTTRELITAIQATWLAGAALMVLPIPMRLGSIDAFIEQTRTRLHHGDVKLVVIDGEFSDFITLGPDDPEMCTLADLQPEHSGVAAHRYERPLDDPEALAVLQFTSGSTSDPKGVMLTHRTICANQDAIAEAGRLSSDDVIVSWLPLYHDMGLVGLLLVAMTSGVDIVQGAPQDFLARPARWMQWISDFKGSVTAGPNFAFVLATRALHRAKDLDLSRMRVLLNGAEPVDAESFRRFLDAAQPFGLDPLCAFPAFGMAETVIGAAFPPPMRGLVTDWVDIEALEHQGRAVPVAPNQPGGRELALLGPPVPGLEFRVVDRETGAALPERRVGELLIRGTSVTSGYYRNPEATQATIVDGWLHTGDLAYLVDGELVICGRAKDVIIVGGRNIYPQDIERVAGAVPGVRTGNVVAFGLEGRAGKQHVVVVAEQRDGSPDEIADAITEGVLAEVGVPVKEVVFLERGTLPKTSSGKLQRAAVRRMYLDDELERIGGTPS